MLLRLRLLPLLILMLLFLMPIFNVQGNVTETGLVADFNAAVSNTAFNLQEYHG